MANKTPIVVAGTVTTVPSGTQDVNILSQTITLAISAASLPLPTGAASELTLVAVKSDLDEIALDTDNLALIKAKTDNLDVALSTCATETTVTGIKTDTDKLTFASTRLLVDGSGVVQPVGGSFNTAPPILTTGQTGQLQLSNTGSLIVDHPINSPDHDLFQRVRVSSPQSLFSSQFLFDKLPLLWDESLTGAATAVLNTTTSMIEMTTTTASGDRAIRQTRSYFIYEPGRAHNLSFTVLFGTGKANCVQSVGLFDDNNGCFLRLNGTTFQAVIRTSTSGSPAETSTDQVNFNIDKLDGSGPSGMTLDITKVQLFFVEYQWFGVGTVRYGVFYNGDIFYFHQYQHTNLNTTPYMQRGSLPIRYEIQNTGTTSGSTILHQICSAVQSEAGYAPTGIKRSIDVGTAGITVSGTNSSPLLSIRLKSTANRGMLIPKAFDIMTTAANNFRYQVIFNGTLTGASFTSVGSTSIAEYDVSATALSGGTIISSGYVSSVFREANLLDFASILRLASNIAGTADILTIYVSNISSGITYFASLDWEEYI